MANAIYDKYKEALLSGSSDSALSTSNVVVSLLNSDVEVYTSTDQFYSDVTTANGVIATVALQDITVSDGVFDANNVTFESVSEQTECEALLFWIDTGNTATSRLIAYMDTNIDGLPITPDGSNVDITWSTDGIFKL